MTSCYIFDIDGTICDTGHRSHHLQKKPKDWDSFYAGCDFDPPHAHIVRLALDLQEQAPLVFMTGRPRRLRDATKAWLTDAGLGGVLFMRANGDFRDDTIVKAEMLDRAMAQGWKPIMAFDDRNKVVAMWRARGVPCAQVAEGDF